MSKSDAANEKKSLAYQEGFEAFYDNWTINQNPYFEESSSWNDWDDGWTDAAAKKSFELDRMMK